MRWCALCACRVASVGAATCCPARCWRQASRRTRPQRAVRVTLPALLVWFVVVGETRRGVALTGCGFRLADVVPQWQRPVVVRRAGADSDGSSDDGSDDETSRRRHVAGWLCNHFQEHFQPRRGGGAHEQKRYDHHRGVMQRRWLPTAEVDRCRPADSEAVGRADPCPNQSFSAVSAPFSAVLSPFFRAVRLPGAKTEKMGEEWCKMGEKWARSSSGLICPSCPTDSPEHGHGLT